MMTSLEALRCWFDRTPRTDTSVASEQAVIALAEGIRRATHRKSGHLASNAPEVIVAALEEAGYSIVHRPASMGGWTERIDRHQHGADGHRVWVFREFHSYNTSVDVFTDLIERAADGLERACFTIEYEESTGDDQWGVRGLRAGTAEDKTEVDRQRERDEAHERQLLADLYAKYGPPDLAAES